MLELYNENDYIINLKDEYDRYNYEETLDLPFVIYMDYTYDEDLDSNKYADFSKSYSEMYEDKWYIDNLEDAVNKIKDKIDAICNKITEQSNGEFSLRYEPENNDFTDDYFCLSFYAESTQPITEPTFLDLNEIIHTVMDMDVEELYCNWEEDWGDPDHTDMYRLSVSGSITSITPGEYCPC